MRPVLEILGIVVAVAVLALAAISAPSLARYIRISRM